MDTDKKRLYVTILTFLALLVFATTLVRGFFYAPSDEVTLPEGVENRAAAKHINTELYPKKIRIPVIGVNADIQYVGITKKGNMATPNNFTSVGWFKYGFLPGETGNAVFAGHVNNGFDLPGVFSKLAEVKEGDDIYIDNISGNTLHFIVINIKTYDYNGSTEEIFTTADTPQIKIITCAGVWLSQYKTHNKRLVVTATLK